MFLPKLRQAKTEEEFAWRVGDNAEAIEEYKKRQSPLGAINAKKEIDEIAALISSRPS